MMTLGLTSAVLKLTFRTARSRSLHICSDGREGGVAVPLRKITSEMSEVNSCELWFGVARVFDQTFLLALARLVALA